MAKLKNLKSNDNLELITSKSLNLRSPKGQRVSNIQRETKIISLK